MKAQYWPVWLTSAVRLSFCMASMQDIAACSFQGLQSMMLRCSCVRQSCMWTHGAFQTPKSSEKTKQYLETQCEGVNTPQWYVTAMQHEAASLMNTWKSLLMMSATPGWRTFTATTRLTPSMVITALCTCSNASMGSEHGLQLLGLGVQAALRVWRPSSSQGLGS